MRIWRTTYRTSIFSYSTKLDMCPNNEFVQLGGILYLTVTQDNIIKEIAEKEDINVATVRKVIKRMEKCIFDYLSSTTPTENTVVKVLDGLSLECKYIPEHEIHTYDDIKCESKIWAKPKITRYYNRKLNNYF